MLTIEQAQAGIIEINQEYIKHQDFTPDDYTIMVMTYLINSYGIDFSVEDDPSGNPFGKFVIEDNAVFFSPWIALIADMALCWLMRRHGFDFGLYEHPNEVGFVGWLTIEQETIFFGPDKVVAFETDDQSSDGDLSPWGEIGWK